MSVRPRPHPRRTRWSLRRLLPLFALVALALAAPPGCDCGGDSSGDAGRGEGGENAPNESEPIEDNSDDDSTDASDANTTGEEAANAAPTPVVPVRTIVVSVDGLDRGMLDAAIALAREHRDELPAGPATTEPDLGADLPALPTLEALRATCAVTVKPPTPATRVACWAELVTGFAPAATGITGDRDARAPTGARDSGLVRMKLAERPRSSSAFFRSLFFGLIVGLFAFWLVGRPKIAERLPQKPWMPAAAGVAIAVIGTGLGMLFGGTGTDIVHDYEASTTTELTPVWNTLAKGGVPVAVTNAPLAFPATAPVVVEAVVEADDEEGETDGDVAIDAVRSAAAARNLSLIAGVTTPDAIGSRNPLVYGDDRLAPREPVDVMRPRYRAYVADASRAVTPLAGPERISIRTLPTFEEAGLTVHRTPRGGEIVVLDSPSANDPATTNAGDTTDGSTDDESAPRVFNTRITGPRGTDAAATPSWVPLVIERQSGRRVELTVPHVRPIALSPGEWTDVIRLSFPRTQGGVALAAVRFKLESVEPLVLVTTPPQWLPARVPEDYPIAYPPGLAGTLAAKMHALGNSARGAGSFSTAGGVADGLAAAWEDGLVSRATVVEQATRELQTQLDLCEAHLNVARWRVAFAHVDALALLAAVLAAPDASSPSGLSYDPAFALAFAMFDRFLARLERNYPDAALLVVGTHGTRSVRTLIDVNAWLVDNGYLVFADDSRPPVVPDPAHPFPGVNWEKTKAFCLDGGRIILNVKDRQSRGGVDVDDGDAVRLQLRADLLGDATLTGGESPLLAAVSSPRTLDRDAAGESAGDRRLVLRPGVGIAAGAEIGAVGTRVRLASRGRARVGADAGPWRAIDAGGNSTTIHARGILLANRVLAALADDTDDQSDAWNAPRVRGIDLADVAPTVLARHGLTPPEGRGAGQAYALLQPMPPESDTIARAVVDDHDVDCDGEVDADESDSDDADDLPGHARPAASTVVTASLLLADSDAFPPAAQQALLAEIADREVRLDEANRPLALLVSEFADGERVLTVRALANPHQGVAAPTRNELATILRHVMDAWLAELDAIAEALAAEWLAEHRQSRLEALHDRWVDLAEQAIEAENEAKAADACATALAEEVRRVGDQSDEGDNSGLEDVAGLLAKLREARDEERVEAVRVWAEHATFTAAAEQALADFTALASSPLPQEPSETDRQMLRPRLIATGDADALGPWPNSNDDDDNGSD